MAYSKIVFNGTTLMDITQDTVTANNLISPNTAHGADGLSVVGTASGGGGMQLYGPYYASASNPSAATAGQQKIVSCDTLEDVNGITVTYPATDAALLLTFLNAGIGGAAKGLFVSVKLPTYDEGSWIDANVQIVNIEEEAKTYEPRIGFYSTVEFPQLVPV